MKNGNWVPISKSFLKHLPHDRAYTKMEAIYSMQCDYDDNRPVTVAGYADLWRWSRKKVALFLEHVGASIEYPENTKDKQNQKGQIRVQIRDRSGTDKAQITFIDNKVLHEEKNRKGTDKGQIRDRSGSTTIETDTKINTEKEDIYVVPYAEILDYLNMKTGKNYRSSTKDTQQHINARIKEGYTLKDFFTVIDNKVRRWSNDRKMREYLTPKTLFGPKFEKYLQDTPDPLDGVVSEKAQRTIENLRDLELT